ncbi:sensor histidine kinase [Paenibacillus eucommiae]|uniref:histidine kinase n=1 Tax=Paenibacillus eucommiae TaxID=1355755 RepID=A0ABS4J6R8_9BACL|nr:sensor histidine kinase [Paenibacillus eucommiae]MBP1995523.1 signal transduction histidine kinase [Paenibacillus eucommiae]
MDEHLHRRMTFFLTLFVLGGTVILLLHTPNFSLALCLLSCSYAILVLLRDYFLKLDLRRMPGTLFIILQLILSIVLSVWSESFFAQIYLLILIGEFTFYHSRTHSIIFTIVSYITILIGVMSYRQFPNFEEIYLLFPRVIDYFAIFGMSLLARIAFQQKNQLALDHEQLQIASRELEQKVKLEERTRISRDIHDSVGHTLTSALTGLQTAAHAIRKNNHTVALDMIVRTEDNIRNGLNDVRTSVHLLRENSSGIPFITELMGLIHETKKQTGVDITYEIDTALPDLPPLMELAIYRALQEGLTNGMKHGASTHFRFSLTCRAGIISFTLTDNGRPPGPIVFGFGLNAMKERLEQVGGALVIFAGDGDRGVTLDITIPFADGK